MTDAEADQYVERCPVCGERLLGMTPEEFRRSHAVEGCRYAPLGPDEVEEVASGPSVADVIDAAWRAR